ncbi:MAG: hypothetical protein A2Z44_04970 [Betaproteobacteria bacterium RBG_19FT_COMBO_58_11]|nr:MAG: hypothetical protein A2Z44_04970 [Betaproteobacteria bacterium RBG_19FT_COMBO_58_11]
MQQGVRSLAVGREQRNAYVRLAVHGVLIQRQLAAERADDFVGGQYRLRLIREGGQQAGYFAAPDTENLILVFEDAF